jgi:signal transduction histidine kinase
VPRHPFLLPLVAAVLFAATLLDLTLDFGLFNPISAAVLFALAAASLVYFLLIAPDRKQWAPLALLLGATFALGVRALGGEESPLGPSPSSFREIRDRDARARASAAKERFRELTEAAGSAAESLAREPALGDAVVSLDAARIARAFDVLAATPLPQAHASGVPGVSLSDRSLRPIAWAGENRSLGRFPPSWRDLPPAEVTVRRRAAETSLVAVHPLRGAEGIVSVEVPLAADRRLENRYLQDYDALSVWAGRSLDVHFFSSDEERGAQAEVFEGLDDPYWAGPEESPRLFFGLRSSAGDLLGIASLAGEAPESARRERHRRLALAAGALLALAAGAALLAFVRSRPGPFPLVAGVLAFRVVLHASGLPLGLGLDLDNPAYYASSLFFGFARSPAEFLVTMAAILLSCWIVVRSDLDAGEIGGILGPAVALVAFVGVHTVILDAWVNSSLGLSEVSFSGADVPRLTVQLGLMALFFSAALVSHRLLAPRGPSSSWSRGSRGSRALLARLALDVALVAAAYVALSPRGYGDRIVLAAIPLVTMHILALRGGRLKEGGIRATLALLLTSVAVFYPGVAWFENASIRNFIESTVTPAALQHASSRWSTLLEAARDIDRMYAEGGLGDLGREDLAFAIWVATDLSVSPLSSSVEILDPRMRVVSRFSLNFPASPLEGEMSRAPQEWVPEERRFPGNPDHPGFGVARRSFLGPDLELWEVRLAVAADWRNLPFISTSDPYLQLFRAAAVETPLRYPHQQLELFVLTHDGRAVFQSVGGSLEPGEELLAHALEAPLWWEHPHEGEVHRTYVVADADYVYALSYPKKLPLDFAAELTRWVLLAGLVAAVGLGGALLLAALGASAGIPPRQLYAGIAASFAGKLYFAFVMLALASIVSLAVLIRGIVIQDLQRDVERESVDRALVAAQLVTEAHKARPTSPLGMAPLTDSVLEHVSALAGVDVDLYIGGELLATSKPELVASGLLGSRAAPAAQREIVVERRSHSLHQESVGAFQYLVVSVPIDLEPWTEPGILSIPLASRQVEIDRRVASLNQTLLLAAALFSIAAAGLAYLLARGIAGPIRELTGATHAVAEGSFDVSLETSSRDEIGALFSSFNQMTEDLKRQREDLEKSKKLEAWAEMARQVAHEVKNPLTPIQLSTEHLLRVYGDPDVDFEKVLKECSETILQQVKTLRQISMEFSTFASPGPLVLEPTDIASLVRETAAPYVQSAPSGIRLEVATASDLPVARVDRRLIQRTLVNLIENALNALNGSGRIEVQVSKITRGGTPFVALTVRDDGVGIEPEVKARVFEPYFSTRAAGTGLGLAIARKVVEDHGGTIALESEPGRGTEVTIQLPVATGD